MLVDCWINQQNHGAVTLLPHPNAMGSSPEARSWLITKTLRRTQSTDRLNSGALILGHAIMRHTHARARVPQKDRATAHITVF
jgi:hypothetical protein